MLFGRLLMAHARLSSTYCTIGRRQRRSEPEGTCLYHEVPKLNRKSVNSRYGLRHGSHSDGM
jgi:hypothetical protein